MPNKKYKVIPTNHFLRELKKIPSEIAGLVKEKKEELAIDPHQGKKLTNKKIGQWRIRVTKDYRLRYDIEGDEVVLITIQNRRDVYKKR